MKIVPTTIVEGSLEEVERGVLDFLRSRRRGATASFIAVKVGKSPELVQLALKKLLLLNIIERRGKFFRAKNKRATRTSRCRVTWAHEQLLNTTSTAR